MNRYQKISGFTLIELMVVIAIITLLSTIILASLTNARLKSRDAKRIADMRNFQTALELYHSANGHYPYTNCSGSNNWTSFDSASYAPSLVCNTVGGAGQTLTQIMAPYIGRLSDPKNLGGDSGYLYCNSSICGVGGGGANDYCMLWWRTPENMKDFPSSFVQAGRCGTINGSGQCSGTNALFLGEGVYRATGC